MPMLHRTIIVTTFFFIECLVLVQCWMLCQPLRADNKILPSTVCGSRSGSTIVQSHRSWSSLKHASSSKTAATAAATSTVLYAKNKNGGTVQKSKKHKKTPKLIIFDLDGCLWSPEMYEILYFMGGRGSPFTPDDQDPRILRTAGGSEVKLLGNVRGIFHELQYSEQWWDTKIGISSRTDQPEWARELLEKFIIFSDDSNDNHGGGGDNYKYLPFPMKQVLTPEICELAQDSKVQHFERILKNAPGKPKFQDCLFFDNELGNCREVAKLGVTVCYCPKGVTQNDWDTAIANFPRMNGKVIGK